MSSLRLMTSAMLIAAMGDPAHNKQIARNRIAQFRQLQAARTADLAQELDLQSIRGTELLIRR